MSEGTDENPCTNMKNSLNPQKTKEREREKINRVKENKTMIANDSQVPRGRKKKKQQSHSCSTLKEKHHEKRAKVIEVFLFCRSHK
jgi:uncharacterized protein (UPF0147 family)